MKYIASSVMIAICLVISTAAEAMPCTDPLDTTEGPIKGKVARSDEACSWLGVPFASPPVGELRLRAPVPPANRDWVLEADQYGFACPQVESIMSGGEARGFDEDCLTLNIWKPRKSGLFPVMVFIHGGGFTQGTGTYEMYNGARLAAIGDVVVVTINYRLAALGYMALPELKEEDPDGSTGNYGILDQVRALEWVRDNIEGFSGDPDKVTIFGQSAGGMSVCTLMVSPLSEGLFHRAVNMSGPCQMMKNYDQAVQRSETMVENLGCDDSDDVTECLRSLPFEDFVKKDENHLFAMGVDYAPTVDGHVLTGMPMDLIREGKYHRVPTMAGCARDELRLYTIMVTGINALPRLTIKQLMKSITGDNYEEVMAMYEWKDYRRPVDLAFSFGTDIAFASVDYAMGEAISDEVPFYMYRFDWDDTRFPHKMGAFHGLDLPLLFSALELDSRLAKMLANKKAIESGVPLSEKMIGYYTNFAATGDPNGVGPGGEELPEWPAYDTETKYRMYFDNPPQARPLSEMEVKRLEYYSSREIDEVLKGRGD